MKDRIDAILQRPQAEYLEGLIPPRDALLARMEEFAHENDHPIADPEVAQTIRILLRVQKPKRVLEVGTNIGYSVVVMGRELDDDAVLETIEIDPDIVRIAKQFVSEANVRCAVIYHEGPALEVLAQMEGTFDFVFIDCVKTEYLDYLDLVLPRMASGGVIAADNVLWKGQVAEGAFAPSQIASTAALGVFNHRLVTDERLMSIVLPIGDGLSVSYVR